MEGGRTIMVDKCVNDFANSFEDLTSESIKLLREKNHKLKQKINLLEEQVIRLCEEFAPGYPKALDSLSRLDTLSVKLKTHSNLQNNNEALKTDIHKMTVEFKDLQERNKLLENEIENSKKTNMKLNSDIKLLAERLSTEVSNKISSDESSIENVVIHNRPMNIKEEYSLFCTGEWFDAKTHLDQQLPQSSEEEKLALLNDVIVKSEKVAKEQYDNFKQRLAVLLRRPISSYKPTLEAHKKETNQQNLSISETVYNVIADHLRNTSDHTDITAITKALFGDLQKNTLIWMKLHHNTDKHEINTFVSSIARIAWKMSLQRPPMTFHVLGLGEKLESGKSVDVHWQSDDPYGSDCRVVCYCYPILCHAGSVLAKGKVLIKKQ